MYISVDIETTGLEFDRDQILQLAAVCPLGCFNAYVEHPRYSGNAYALSLNSKILKKLSRPSNDDRIMRADRLYDNFELWIKNIGLENRRLFAMGKNFGAFDRQFLRVHDSRFDKLFHYRSLDVGSLYANRNGIASLAEIVEANPYYYEGLNQHDAEDDAMIAYRAAMVKMDLPKPSDKWWPVAPVKESVL